MLAQMNTDGGPCNSSGLVLGEPQDLCFTNDWHAKWIREDPQNFIGFASIHPSIKNPLDELKRRQDQGFSGIGECHPWVQGSTLRNPIWMQCMHFADNAGWPVTFRN